MLRTPSSSVIGRNSFTICRHTSRRDNEPERSWNNSIQIWNCFSVLNLFHVSPVRASDHRTETKAEILCRETVYCVQRRRWETLHSVDISHITHHFTNCGSIDENNKYRFAAFRSSSDHLSSPRISGRFYMRDSGSPWSVPRVGMGSTRPGNGSGLKLLIWKINAATSHLRSTESLTCVMSCPQGR